MTTDLQTTSWDNSNIYKDFEDPKLPNDIDTATANIATIKTKAAIFENVKGNLEETIALAREVQRLVMDTEVMLHTIHSYAHAALSTDTKNYKAGEISGKMFQLTASLSQAEKPLRIFLL